MRCSLAGCAGELYTMWRGFGLCRHCYEFVLEWPDTLPMEDFIEVLSSIIYRDLPDGDEAREFYGLRDARQMGKSWQEEVAKQEELTRHIHK